MTEPDPATGGADAGEAARFAALQAHFMACLDLPLAEVADHLARLRADDPALADAVAGLLAEDARPSRLESLDGRAGLGAALEAFERALAPGSRVDRYVIEQLVGAGGMGRVYRARFADPATPRTVAIKVLHPLQSNDGLLSRFSAEHRILASLQHPGICAFLDAGRLDSGLPYVVMEYVDGMPIDAHCAARGLSLEQRVALVLRVARAVGHAHQRLVVHRDIKPANVLVTDEGDPKLLDFGIGKWIEPGHPGVTRTGERWFSPATAAPEQLLGEPTGVGCDVYGLGTLLYALVAGRPVFVVDGLRAAEVERLVLGRAPEPASAAAAVAGVPWATRLRGDLDAIIARCLRKRPEERYREVSELCADLEAWMNHRAVRARGTGRWYRARLFLLRHRVTVPLAAALGLSLLVGIVLVTRQNIALREQRVQAEQAVLLLEEALLGADPTGLRGEALSVREVLQTARERIATLQASQPAVFLRLSRTLARVELNGLSETRAAEIALQAIAVAEDEGLPEAGIADLRVLAARALMSAGDDAGAERLLAAARPATDAGRGELLAAQARLANLRRDFPRAEALATEAVALLATGELGTAETLAREELAAALAGQDRGGPAHAALRELLARQQARLGDSHPSVLSTQVELLRRADPATPIDRLLDEYARIESRLIEAHGVDSPMTGYLESTRAFMLHRVGQIEAAREAFARAHANWQRTLGAGHIRTLRLGFNLAVLTAREPARSEEAVELLQSVVRDAERSLAPGRSAANYFRHTLGTWLARDGRWDELLRLLTTPHALASDIDDELGNLQGLASLGRDVLQRRCGSAITPPEAACNDKDAARAAPGCACPSLAASVDRLQARIDVLAQQ